MDAAILEEFLDFYKTYYLPDNAVLSIAGDLEYDQAEAWVRLYFDDILRVAKRYLSENNRVVLHYVPRLTQ